MSIIRLAIREAAKSPMKRAKLGAVLIKGKRVFAVAHNDIRHKKGNFKKKWNNSLHAEQAALLQVDPEDRKGATLVVIRVGANGDIVNACPCEVCRHLIIDSELKDVIYSNEHGDLVRWKVRQENSLNAFNS